MTKEERTVYADEAWGKQPQLLERLGEERADCGLEDGWHEAAQEAAEESAPRRGARSFMDEDEERLVFVVSLQL